MTSFVIRHLRGFPDEIEADRYENQGDDVVFLKGGKEVFRIPKAGVVSVEPRKDS